MVDETDRILLHAVRCGQDRPFQRVRKSEYLRWSEFLYRSRIPLTQTIVSRTGTAETGNQYDFGDNEEYIDYEKIYLSRFKVLRTAFENSHIEQDEKFQEFVHENGYWLDDYALYMAVKNSFDGVSFIEWDEDIKLRKEDALKSYRNKYKEEIVFYQFQQFLFAKQWSALNWPHRTA